MSDFVDVELLGNGGHTTPVRLNFQKDQIIHVTLDSGDTLLRCKRSCILRWRTVDREDRSSDLKFCVDLQVLTEEGPHILRFRCPTEESYDIVRQHLQGKSSDLSARSTLESVEEELSAQRRQEDKRRSSEERRRRMPSSRPRRGGNLESPREMKRKDDGGISKILRSFGSRKRATSHEQDADSAAVSPDSPTTLEGSKKDVTSPEKQSWKLADREHGEPEVAENVQAADKELREGLSESMEILRRQSPERRLEGQHELKSLYGKVEILLMENERLEAAHRGLAQSLSEMQEERRSLKGTIQTLSETNEDIFVKFNTLTIDYQQQKEAFAEVQTRCAKAEGRLQAWEAESTDFEKQKKAAIEEQQRIEDEYRKQHQVTKRLEEELEQVRSDIEGLRKANTALKEGLENERCVKEASESGRQEVELQLEHLADVLARKEAALKALQSTEHEQALQIEEALTKTKTACHERDLATKKETEMARQVEILAQRLTQQRNDLTVTLQSQWKREVDEAAEAVRHTQSESRQLKTEVMAGSIKIQQLSHEKELLEKRVEQLTSTMTSSQICCSLTGISVSSVAELEKIQRLEFERQAAVDDFESLKNKHIALKKTLDADTNRFQVETDASRKLTFDMQQEKNRSESEVLRLEHEVTSLRALLETEKANHAARERKVELQLASLEAKHRKKLQRIDERGTKAMEAMERRLGEATAIVEEKEALQRKWKEETVEIASQLDSFAAQHQQSDKEYRKRISTLATDFEALRSENQSLQKSTEKTKGEVSDLERGLATALYQNARLEQEFADLDADYRRVHDALRHSREEVQTLKDLIKHTERQRDSFGLRYESMRRKVKLRNAQIRSDDSACSGET